MQRGYAYERQQSSDRNKSARAGSGGHAYRIQESGRSGEDYAERRPGRSTSRHRRRQQRLYRSILAIWVLAFVIGLLCGKIVFAKDTGLLARVEAGFAAEKSDDSTVETAGQKDGTEEKSNSSASGAGTMQIASAEDADSWQLTLVNADHPMEDGYRPRFLKSRIITILTAAPWPTYSRCWPMAGKKIWTSGFARLIGLSRSRPTSITIR